MKTRVKVSIGITIFFVLYGIIAGFNSCMTFIQRTHSPATDDLSKLLNLIADVSSPIIGIMLFLLSFLVSCIPIVITWIVCLILHIVEKNKNKKIERTTIDEEQKDD